jgi:hypothetical protein
MRTKLLLLTLTAALLFGAIANVSAQAPLTFLYQGRLTDANDQPIVAVTSVTFAIVTVPSGVTPPSLYDTVAAVTPNDNGVFSIELGPLPESAFTGGKRWLSVTVGGTELLPRQLITSVPYAMSAERVAGVANMYGTYKYLSSGNTSYTVDSVEIEVPSEGYVEVCAGGFVNVFHTAATITMIYLGVSDVAGDAGGLPDGAVILRVPASSATDTWQFPFYVTRLLAVSAGTNKFYFNAYYASGSNATTNINKIYMRAKYFPAAYGTVPSLAPTQVVSPQDMKLGPDGLPLDDTRPGR